ncbi:hypothetical protein [Pelagerythrobacter sp.]|uniref:hypothetical protein n=1 Tax=Pelagerythrobacter sp. TaxID=2800702 RepID=UPI0035AE01B8
MLAALTVGVPLSCIAGISAMVAAAKPLGIDATTGIHSAIYYAVFLAFTAWALLRGAPRAAIELIPMTGAAFTLVPIATLLFGANFPAKVWLVDVLALVSALALIPAWRAAVRRAKALPRDSVWSFGDTPGKFAVTG